jgi:hypothetical protein
MVMEPGIEEISNGDQSPQLLGWIDISDILRAFLDREQAPAPPGGVRAAVACAAAARPRTHPRGCAAATALRRPAAGGHAANQHAVAHDCA